jgi:hypothetical protein
MTPGEIVRNRLTKKPLCSNRQEKNREQKRLQTSAPASTLSFFSPLFLACLLQQRAGLKFTSPIQNHK